MELVDETCEDIAEQSRASCSASIVSIDSAELHDTSHPEEKKVQEKSPCVAQVTSTVILSSVSCLVLVTFYSFLFYFRKCSSLSVFLNLKDEEDVFSTADCVREDSNSVQKKEIADLLNEIEYLKKQLLGYSNVHEQNVKLSKEVEDLRRENLGLRAAHSAGLCFEDRLQRLLLNDTEDTGE